MSSPHCCFRLPQEDPEAPAQLVNAQGSPEEVKQLGNVNPGFMAW